MEQGGESCPSAPPGFRLSHQNSNNFSHKGRGFNERGISTHALEKLHKKRQNSDFFLFFFLHIYKKQKPPQPRNQGGGAATDGGTGRGELPSQQFLQSPVPWPAGEHGSRCRSERGVGHPWAWAGSPSVHPQLGVPVIRGGDHLVGVAVLRAEGQLVRGLHAAVDLWGG